MLVVRGIELVKAGKFGVSQRSRLGWKSNEAFDEIVTGIGVKRRPYPGKTLLCCERLGALFHLLCGERFEKCELDPGFAVIFVEEFAFGPAPFFGIGLADHKSDIGMRTVREKRT